MNLDTLLAFGGIVFFLAIIPGPNALLILFTALTQSRRFAIANILGVALGFMIHAFVSAKGLSLLLSQSALAFNILKWMGVAYLVWLGINNLKSGLKLADQKLKLDRKVEEQTLKQAFVKGLLTNLLNPKIVLFYLSIFPQFVQPEHILEQSMILGALQAGIVASWYLFVIFFATKLKVLLTSSKTSKWLNYVSGALFISFGVGLANTRF
ncbi:MULTISPECIES: LysE family translocator [Vibrio]|jgi:RhtB (resistance to homoserine/threonine) family protein|uniref:LysE family translocator n=2 Tax=Vibrio harveyi TaxID=669 RepID=A0A3A1PUB6_VIBHA|nr:MULTISPECIES: LysE family translocator [Vibrio]AMF99264.1 LysE family translocator [Vibrio harveyi]APP04408.1 homoserine lactone transporter [Vibrio harveyi]EKM14469.1 lysE type translocator family protein [Vibrio harveyi]EKO3785980.1 LysE family translocator [Vibrio harveyi]EKO3787236.1 LysE family translocator [Vibrio harveyi]